jgi:hypothetical protein
MAVARYFVGALNLILDRSFGNRAERSTPIVNSLSRAGYAQSIFQWLIAGNVDIVAAAGLLLFVFYLVGTTFSWGLTNDAPIYHYIELVPLV